MLLAIGFIFFSVLYLVLRNLPEGVFVTDAGERIYWVSVWICLIAVFILGALLKQEITKGNNAPNAKDHADTEDGSAC